MVEREGSTGVIEAPVQIETWGEIPLRNRKGEVIGRTLVDLRLFPLLAGWRWHKSHGYAESKRKVNGKWTNLLLHRLIWEYTHGEIPEGQEIDHINGNRADNRLSNLRLVTVRQNAHNRKDLREGTKSSSYVGVSWDRTKGFWQSRIKYKGRQLFLGYYGDEYQAHLAYQTALERIERGEEPRDYSSRDSQAPSSPL